MGKKQGKNSRRKEESNKWKGFSGCEVLKKC